MRTRERPPLLLVRRTAAWIAKTVRFERACLIAALAATTGCGSIPDLVVDLDGAPVTSEDGTSVAISVRLTRRPARPVTVEATSSDPSEGTVSAAITFDRFTWDEPQTITVTGVDDALRDGDVSYRVTLRSAVVGRPEWGSRIDEVIDFVNRDDERVAFETLGDLPGGEVGSFATDISASGAIVVGYSSGANGFEAIRFTTADGLTPLGAAPSQAQDISPNGQIIVGYASGGIEDAGAIFLGDGGVEYLQGIPGPVPELPPMFSIPYPEVVLDDGTIYGSCQQYRNPLLIGCRYDGPGLLTQWWRPSVILAVDNAGRAGGARYGNRYEPITAVPVLDDAFLPFPADAFCITPGVCAGVVQALAANVPLAVGTSHIPPPTDDLSMRGPVRETAFTYTDEEGSQRLADVAGGDELSGAYAVSDDGRIIGGYGTDEAGTIAVLWLDRVPVALPALLAQQGGELPAGYRPLEVRALSADGRTIAGNGVNEEGLPEAFRVALPDPL